jgi:hypothetical protein
MIPQADLDRALARWKARQTGQEPPTPGPSDLGGQAPTPTPVVEVSSAVININEPDESEQL